MKKSIKKSIFIFSIALVYALISILLHNNNLLNYVSFNEINNTVKYNVPGIKKIYYEYDDVDENGNIVIVKNEMTNNEVFYAFSNPRFYIEYSGSKDNIIDNISVKKKSFLGSFKEYNGISITSRDEYGDIAIRANSWTNGSTYELIFPDVLGSNKKSYIFSISGDPKAVFTNLSIPDKVGYTDDTNEWLFKGNIIMLPSTRMLYKNNPAAEIIMSFNKENGGEETDKFDVSKKNMEDVSDTSKQSWYFEYSIKTGNDGKEKPNGIYNVSVNFKINGKDFHYEPGFKLNISNISGKILNSSINVTKKNKIITNIYETDRFVRYAEGRDYNVIGFLDKKSSNNNYVEFLYSELDERVNTNSRNKELYDNSLNKELYDAVKVNFNEVIKHVQNNHYTKDENNYFDYRWYKNDNDSPMIDFERNPDSPNLIKYYYFHSKNNTNRDYNWYLLGNVDTENPLNQTLFNEATKHNYIDGQFNPDIYILNQGVNAVKSTDYFTFENNYVAVKIIDPKTKAPKTITFTAQTFDSIDDPLKQYTTEFDYQVPERMRIQFTTSTPELAEYIKTTFNNKCNTNKKTDCYKFVQVTPTDTAELDNHVFSIGNFNKENDTIWFDLYYLKDGNTTNTTFGDFKIVFMFNGNANNNNDNDSASISFSIPRNNFGYYVYTSTSDVTYKNIAEIYTNNNLLFNDFNVDNYKPGSYGESDICQNIDSNYLNFRADYNNNNNVTRQQKFLKDAFDEYVSFQKDYAFSDLFTKSFTLNTEDGCNIYKDYLDEYTKFYSHLMYNYNRYYDGEDRYYTFNEKVNEFLNSYAEIGPPGNITTSNLNLGYYVKDSNNAKINLSNYSTTYISLPHNVEEVKSSDTDDAKYRYYDTKRHKLIITDIGNLTSNDKIDVETSNITYKLINYKTNTTTEENVFPAANHPDVNSDGTITQNIPDFISTMASYGLDVEQAFNHEAAKDVIGEDVYGTSSDPLNIGNSLLDHIVKDSNNKIHITYNDSAEGFYITEIRDRDLNATNDNSCIKFKTVESTSDYYLNPRAAKGYTTTVTYGVSSDVNYADYYYLNTTGEIEVANAENGTMKPVDGVFIFEQKIYLEEPLKTKEELMATDQAIDIGTNKYCEGVEKQYYNDGVAEVCYNSSNNDHWTYPQNINVSDRLGEVANEIERITETLKAENLTPDEIEAYSDQLDYFNKEYNALSGICQTLEERNEWCSVNAGSIAPLKRVYNGTYFLFTTLNGDVDFGYKTNNDYFPIYLYPALAGQNSHMTKVSYADPLYVIDYKGVDYSINNVVDNNMQSAYSNISNNININFVLEQNDDNDLYRHMKLSIEKMISGGNSSEQQWSEIYTKIITDNDNSDDGITWKAIGSNNHIISVNEFYAKTNINASATSSVNILTEPGMEEGLYRIALQYDDGIVHSKVFYQEFRVSGTYHNIQIKDSDELSFNQNISRWKSTYLNGVNIPGINEDVERLNSTTNPIVFVGNSDDVSDKKDKLVFDFGLINENYVDYSNYYIKDFIENDDHELEYHVYNKNEGVERHEFTFKLVNVQEEQIINSLSDDGEEELTYTELVDRTKLVLYNVADAPIQHEYAIRVQYIYENDGKIVVSEDSTKFTIGENKYSVEILDTYKMRVGNEEVDTNVKPLARFNANNERTLSFFVRCSYIPSTSLDNIGFEIVYYNGQNYTGATNNSGMFNPAFIEPNEIIWHDVDENIHIAEVEYTINEYGLNNLASQGYKNFLFRTYYGVVKLSDNDIDVDRTATYDRFNIRNINNYFKWSVSSVSSIGTPTNGDEIVESLKSTTINSINEGQTPAEDIILYNNMSNHKIAIDITTPYVEAPSIAIDDVGKINISSVYNSAFTIEKTVGNTLNSRRITLNYTSTTKMTEDRYIIRLSYNNNDYKDIRLRVINEYVGLDLVSYNVNNMFLNYVGSLDVDLKLTGIEASNPNLYVKILDDNLTQVSSGFNNLYITNTNKIHIEKPIGNIRTGTYYLSVYYEKVINGNKFIKKLNTGTESDYIKFNVGSDKFSYYVRYMSTEPRILVKSGKGEIRYRITTEGINIGSDPSKGPMKQFANNTKIYLLDNGDRIDVTGSFATVKAVYLSSDTFDIVISYNSNNLIYDGVYEMTTSYTNNGYTIDYSSNNSDPDYNFNFVINRYYKQFDLVDGPEIIGGSNDGSLHNNLSWGLKYYYDTDNELVTSYMRVEVYDTYGAKINSNAFIYDVNSIDKTIILSYDGSYKITPGWYYARIIYDEDSSIQPCVFEVSFAISGNYKIIEISKDNQSSTTLLSDVDDQSLTINVSKEYLEDNDFDNLKVRITDEEGFVLYTDRTNNQVLNSLTVNNTVDSNGKITITFMPYKFRVGTYNLTVELPDDVYVDEYNSSNILTFEMEATNYQVVLSDNSRITPKVTYNNTDTIYDDKGLNLHYEFTTDYPITDGSEVSIRTFKGLQPLDDYTDITFTTNNDVYIVDTQIDSLTPGDIDFAICINGMPYQWITRKVEKFIPTTVLGVKVNGKTYSGSAKINLGKDNNYPITVVSAPSNATDKAFVISSNDSNVLSYANGTLYAVNDGTATLTISNSDLSVSFTVNVASQLLSDVYTIDNENKIITVRGITSLSLDRNVFVSNISNLSSDYTYNNNSNNTSGYVGTGDVIVSSGMTYSIIMIGDVTQNGRIDLGDVARIYSHYRGTERMTGIIEQAGHVLGRNNISLADVAKTYSFYKGTERTL